jgi:3-oxoacyl-[acyl-carrier protein] reductase
MVRVATPERREQAPHHTGSDGKMTSQNNRVALVTGGARGIGAGIVERLVSDGARVAFTYAGDKKSADALVDGLVREGGQVLALQADSSKSDDIAQAVNATVAHFGTLDILVNSAGRYVFGPLADMSDEEIDSMFALNVRGTVAATRFALPHLGKGGRIINIGSTNADTNPFPGGSIYALTKGAIASFTRGLSIELAPRGITTNTVQPGPIHTDGNPDDGPMADFVRGFIPAGRFGSVDDVASLVSYLASEESRHITGTAIAVDGGMSA